MPLYIDVLFQLCMKMREGQDGESDQGRNEGGKKDIERDLKKESLYRSLRN